MHQDADFQGPAQPYTVGDEDAGPCLLERLGHRYELVGGKVHGGLVADVEMGVGGGRAAEEALQVEAGTAVVGAGVGDQAGVLREEFGDLVQLGEEDGLLVADEGGEAGDVDRRAASGGGADQ